MVQAQSRAEEVRRRHQQQRDPCCPVWLTYNRHFKTSNLVDRLLFDSAPPW
jgi:hypothetical protein